MPSNEEPTAIPPKVSFWALARSQGLGLICGQLTVLLLGVGSIVITKTRDTASASLVFDDMRPFFDQPSGWHFWFYALLVVMTVYGLNTLLATLHNVWQRWSVGVRAPSAYAAAIVHIGFLLALVAHLVGGLYSEELDPVVIGSGWTGLGDGRSARLEGFDFETFPDGKPSKIAANVEVVDVDKQSQSVEVGFNHPISTGFGEDLFLFNRMGQTLQIANIRSSAGRCQLAIQNYCDLADVRLLLVAVQYTPQGVPVALLRATHASLDPEEFHLYPTQGARLADGTIVRLDGLEPRPSVILRHRHAPGNPVAFAASLIMLLGLALMGRRWLG